MIPVSLLVLPQLPQRLLGPPPLPTTKKPKKFSRADNASKKRQREAGKGHDDAAEETPTKKKTTTAGGSSHNDIGAPNTLKQESGSSRKQLKKPTFTKEETEARKELERGRLEAMRTGSTASSPGEGEAVWKQRKREDVVARGLGLPDASDSSTFLGKLLGEVGAGVGVAVDDVSSFSSFPEGRAQEELGRASKALKALWRFGMTAALLGKHPTLVKLLKALRKKHPDDKIKSMAGTIFDKWLCVYGAATPNPSPPSSSSSSSPPPPSASLAQEATPLAVAANVVDDVTRSEGNQEIIAQGNADVVPAHDAASSSSSPAAQPTGVATSSENGPLASVRLSSAVEVATSRKGDMETKRKDGTGIEDKLREKVKAALRGKNVTEEKVLVTEAALYQAAASDKTRFKELTRLLAKEITESPETLASLNTGAVDPPDLVAKCSLLSSAP